MKAQYDRSFQARSFNERDLVLTYDQKHDKLGAGKLESMCLGPYVISCVFEKGAYDLMDYKVIPLVEPHNGI